MKDEIEKILERYKSDIKSLHHSIAYRHLDLTPDEKLEMEDVETAKALTSIINLVDKEIIGLDEFEGSPELIGKHARNNLRAEMRAKLKGVSNG